MEKQSKSQKVSFDGQNTGAILGKLVFFDYSRTTTKKAAEYATEATTRRLNDHRADVVGRVVSVGTNKAGEFYLVVENSLIRDKAENKPQPRTYKPAGISNLRVGTVAPAGEVVDLLAADLAPKGEDSDEGETPAADQVNVEGLVAAEIVEAHRYAADTTVDTFSHQPDYDGPATLTEAVRNVEAVQVKWSSFGTYDKEIRDKVQAAISEALAGNVLTVPMSPEQWGLSKRTGARTAALELHRTVAQALALIVCEKYTEEEVEALGLRVPVTAELTEVDKAHVIKEATPAASFNEAMSVIEGLRKKHEDFGTGDSEVRHSIVWALEMTLKGKKFQFPTTAMDLQMYSDMDGAEEAAKELSEALKVAAEFLSREEYTAKDLRRWDIEFDSAWD